MPHRDMETGTRDVTYNLVSVLYHALQGAETYLMYQADAEHAEDRELAEYFGRLVEEESRRADQTKALLRTRLK